MKRFCLYLLLLLVSANVTFAQTPILDSLRKQFSVEKSKALRIKLANEICSRYFSLSSDTLLHYIQEAEKIFGKGSLDEYHNDQFYIYYLLKSGNPAGAVKFYDSLYAVLPAEFNDSHIRIDLLNAGTNAMIRNDQSKRAIESAFEMLRMAESTKDTLMIMRAYNLIGWAKMEMEQDGEALEWFRKGINFSKRREYLVRMNSLFTNSASCLNNLMKQDSAAKLIDIGMELATENENLTLMANAHNIKASILLAKNKIPEAEAELNEGLKLREKIGDLYYILSDQAQLSLFYSGSNQTEKGIEVAKRGIALARSINNIPKLLFLYAALSDNYKNAKNFELYSKTLREIIDLKDSLYAMNTAEQLAGFQAKYEVQQKENIILQQDFALERNKYYLWGGVVLFILSGIVVFLVYKNRRIKEEERVERLMIEQQIKSREAIQVAREIERKRIAADLHDNLGAYAAAISSNTKTIRESKQPTEQVIGRLEENAQSIVTQLSDTIWVLKNEQLPFTSLCDRFKVWMQRLMKSYPEIRYDFSENIKNDIVFSPAKMLHLFLVMKEVVNNSLKHSGATTLSVAFESDNGFSIEITDNGSGFVPGKTSGGSGIENMRRRIAECGWTIEWKTSNEKGTNVKIKGSTAN